MRLQRSRRTNSSVAGSLPALTRSILLSGATEPPWSKTTSNGVNFSGSYSTITADPGTFSVAGVPLFTTDSTWGGGGLSMSTSTSPWLSFPSPLPGAAVTTRPDTDGVRTEALFSGLHLGHYFPPSSYCINAAALTFTPRSPRTAVLGAGCFWGAQEAFSRVVGVLNATAGYAGDDAVSCPVYEDLKADNTLVEVVKVEYDESVLTLQSLVALFMTLHDPSLFSAAGHRGPGGRYRSFLACEDVGVADDAIDRFRREALGGGGVATERREATEFTAAEARHQHRHGVKGVMEPGEW